MRPTPPPCVPPQLIVCLCLGLLPTFALPLSGAPAGTLSGSPWKAHPIDADGRGADGTKLADLDGDGRLDIVTGWEEDGTTRVYLHPGYTAVRRPWPKVVVGRTPDVEDAVFADLDGDGRPDVVSSTEGASQQVFVHWAPPRDRLLEAAAWRQDAFPALARVTRWMFAEPHQLDGQRGLDLVVGGKRVGSTPSYVGWLQAPDRPRDLAAWAWHPLVRAGWIMTLRMEDMDGDGDADLLYSDRYDENRGIHWLENPGPARVVDPAAWRRHTVGASAVQQVMLIDVGDIDGDGLPDIAAPVQLARTDPADPNRDSQLRWYRRLDRSGLRWNEHVVSVPENTGNVKHVAIGDLDADGRADLVVSCEHAAGARVGVYWLRGSADPARTWRAFDLAGAPGIKFDLVRLLDLDGDGDLDVLTNEEQEYRRGLGVLWYENPHR